MGSVVSVSYPAALTLDPVDPTIRAAAHDLANRLGDDSPVEQAVKAMLADVAGGSRVIMLRADQEVTPSQAAAMIGVTRQYVDRLCADGVLPFHHLPNSNHRRINVQDVIDVATEREARQTSTAALRAAMGTLND